MNGSTISTNYPTVMKNKKLAALERPLSVYS
jgi:hypothetical protein